MSDTQEKWIFVAIVVTVLAIAELVIGWVLNLGITPLDRICRRLPRKIQMALLVLLFATAAGAWLYGCSRPGFR